MGNYLHISKFYDLKINQCHLCIYFLAKDDTELPICTSSQQYMKYRELGENLSHASSDNYWDLIGCTPRCKFTKYKLKPMVEGTNDENKIMMKKADGANIEVKPFRISKN